MSARIEEFDLKGPVLDQTFLSYELIKPRLSDFASAIRGRIRSAIVAWRSAVQRHLKSNGLTVLGRTQHEIQITAVEAKYNLPARFLKHSAFFADFPRSN